MRIFFFSLLISICFADYCLFTPPDGWEIARTKTPSEHVQVGFLGKASGGFRPCMNIAFEEDVDVPLKEYVRLVKELQKEDKNSTCRDLGDFQGNQEAGRLLEITTPSPWGDLRLLQALFVKDQRAYILTASFLKKDFVKLQKEVLSSFRSFSFVKDIKDPIRDVEKQRQFGSFFEHLSQSENPEEAWKTLQSKVEEHQELGSYWAFIALQEGRKRIFEARSANSLEESSKK